MADKIWEPKAKAVAQTGTIQITAYDAATNYILSVNGVELVNEAGDTDASTTASNMQAAWDALAHPYAAGITATVTTDTLTFTGDDAEEPFTITPSVSGGTGTIGSYTADANATNGGVATGPHTFDEPENWSGEALPSNSDRIIIPAIDSNIVWGLDGLSTTGHELIIPQGYSGIIGLEPTAVATSADGETTDSGAPEYRTTDLTLDCSIIEIGAHQGPGNPGGSRRIRIDNDRASASQTNVINSGGSGFSSGQPPVLLKFANANADVNVQSGLVGIAVGLGETATVGDIVVQDGQLFVGDGTTISGAVTHWQGTSEMVVEVATLSTLTMHGGQLVVRGDQALTTVTIWGGELFLTTTGTITTLNARGGTVDFTDSGEARTLTTLNLFAGRGARVVYDPGVLTVTNDVTPDSSERVDITRT